MTVGFGQGSVGQFLVSSAVAYMYQLYGGKSLDDVWYVEIDQYRTWPRSERSAECCEAYEIKSLRRVRNHRVRSSKRAKPS